MNSTGWTRRGILLGTTTWVAARTLQAANAPTRKAAIIGHTGAGDYGHGMQRIFQGLPGVAVVAVADPNAAGRAKAKAACGAARDYADFREMLVKEKPELVAVSPRWATEYHAMALAALEAGAHVYLEKPFTTTLAEADDILRLAQARARRVAVAHVTRCAPIVLRLETALRKGLIGDMLEIHTVGRMGSRAGGQDMMADRKLDFQGDRVREGFTGRKLDLLVGNSILLVGNSIFRGIGSGRGFQKRRQHNATSCIQHQRGPFNLTLPTTRKPERRPSHGAQFRRAEGGSIPAHAVDPATGKEATTPWPKNGSGRIYLSISGSI